MCHSNEANLGGRTNATLYQPGSTFVSASTTLRKARQWESGDLYRSRDAPVRRMPDTARRNLVAAVVDLLGPRTRRLAVAHGASMGS